MAEADEAGFVAYVEGLASVIGHADRRGPLRDYVTGLMLPVERKSVEPMAAATSPARVAAQHQSLLHFVGQGAWSDEKVLAKVREMVLPTIQAHGAIEAWIIDDTGLPKKGRHSVGVARQYCGQLGKQDNCQVAVSLSLANAWASLPVAWRLYLPKEWAEDGERRRKAGVPQEVRFATKPELALEQIRWAVAAGLPRGVVLMDAGYGWDARLRTGVASLGLTYAAGVLPKTLVFLPGHDPVPGHKRPKSGRRQAHMASIGEIALGLAPDAWRMIQWREGSSTVLEGRFARLRIRSAHRHKTQDRPEEWLLVEWPEGEPEPLRYWLSNLPADIAFDRLVELTKTRWRIERDYQDLKQEVGLGHFEGRGWRGFHHHATLCIAAYGFLISQRETIPPSADPRTQTGAQPAVPSPHRPRGSPAQARTPHPQLHRLDAKASDPGPGQTATAMPLLRRSTANPGEAETLMTQ